MAETQRERRLAAIVSADVAGYARLMSRDEDAAFDAIRALREEVVQPLAAEAGGRLVKTMGDGFLLEFASAAAAVDFAIALQAAAARRPAGPGAEPVRLRVGVNLGDVIIEGDDIFGDGVNIAARLEAVADPGGVCVSQEVLSQIGGRLPVKTEDLGERALKNIERPVRAHRLLLGAAAATTAAGADLPPAGWRRERLSLAILPFRNLGDETSGFVAQGVALGLQTLLVQLPNLFFVNAVMHRDYAEGRKTAAEALAGEPVGHAIEGSLRQSGQRIRLQVRITDLKTGALVWAETYDRDLGDLFALEDEIARRIAGALTTELVGGHFARDFTGGLDAPDAWEEFLRGINQFYQIGPATYPLALKHFRRLAEISPESGIAPNYLATLHYMAASRGWETAGHDAFAEARRWAEVALAQPHGGNGLGQAVLSALALRDRRHDDSLRFAREAVAYRASCPFAIGQYGAALTFSGEPARGVKHLRESVSLRFIPLADTIHLLAIAQRDRGEIGLSIPAAKEAERLQPGFVAALATLCTDHVLAGNLPEARATAARIGEIAPDFSAAGFASGLPYRHAGPPEAVERALLEAGLPA